MQVRQVGFMFLTSLDGPGREALLPESPWSVGMWDMN